MSSTPISGLRKHPTQQDTDATSTGNAPDRATHAQGQSQTPASGAANHSLLGKLAKRMERAGEKAMKENRRGLDKTNAELKPTMAAGYEVWAVNNAISAGNGLVSTFHGANAVTGKVSAATNDAGVATQGLEIASTAVAFADTSLQLIDAGKKVKVTDPVTLEGKDASSAHRQAKGNLLRAIPTAIRNVGVGSVNEAGRIFTAQNPGHSMYGNKLASVHADGAIAIGSGVTYIVGGLLQSAKVDRGVDRAQALRSSVLRPASGRTDSESEAMQKLDEAFARSDFSANVYSILRTRSDTQVDGFLGNFAALNPDGRQRLLKLLHFPGVQNAMKVLNMGRATNLNTASTRRAAREEVIDAFIEKKVTAADTAGLFDALKKVRSEALGAKTSPEVVALEQMLSKAGFEPDELTANVLKAVAQSVDPQEFVNRYKALPREEDRKHLQSILHFGSWRFWKADATLPTTKYQRSDIRAELIRQFMNGATLDRLDAMKIRYNEKVLPLQTGRTHPRQEPADAMRRHILAYQDGALDTLKEEKQNAKIQVAYGTVNIAAGIAELAINPGAAAGVSASRAVLAPLYYAYNGLRGIVAEINHRNAQPIDALMRDEALRYALPQVNELIAAGGSNTSRLADRRGFLRDTFGLSDADIRKVDMLERSGKGPEARAMLAQKNPEANVLIALRVLAEESADNCSNPAKRNTPSFIATEAAASGSASLQAIDNLSDPDKTFAALREHFIDNESFNPSAGLAVLAQKLSAGTAIDDYGIDKTRAEGKSPLDLQQRFANDNPWFATRLFVTDLVSGGEPAVAARNMLRDFRFSETEIGQLQKMDKKDAWTWLDRHLFGEDLRRRFSTQKLDQGGRDNASAVVEHMPVHQASADEPLTWRRDLEDLRVNVIANAGTPGLDSMLHALYQNFSGKTDSSSSEMQRKVMEARRRVIADVTPASPGTRVDVMQHRDAIVRIAGQVFGKPDATVKIVLSSGEGDAQRVGTGRGDQNVPIAAVLCYDAQTRRTFALHGGDARKAGAKAPQIPPSRFDEDSLDQDMSDAFEVAVRKVEGDAGVGDRGTR
ncbi:hypothetical protein [Paraburkholderia sp.]|uniref:hypothetical protein n=1 Tax=Paraburkholderia sp. TaxID=1926495 RepID=UPI003D6FB682